MTTKEVNVEKLADEIGHMIDAAYLKQHNSSKSIVRAAIEAHNPTEENIARPWDIIRYKGQNDRYLVTTREACGKNTQTKNFNRHIPVWNGDRFLCFSMPDDNVITEDGKPVTGYEDK